MHTLIAIVDYGLGNLLSIKQSLKRVGLQSFLSCDAKEIESADKIILPGVGAFPDAMDKLKKLKIEKKELKKCYKTAQENISK